MAGTGPGILPKTALVASRAIYYPFSIPEKWTESMNNTGQALNTMAKNLNGSIGSAYMSLEPRGPAKWLAPLFGKVDQATDKSAAIGKRNYDVFWKPMSHGIAEVGSVIASPGAYWYLKKAGMEQPTHDAIKGVLEMPFFSFPTAPAAPAPEEPAGDAPTGEAPPADAQTQEAPAPTGGAGDAAAGAGETQTPAA